jgi:hypothetical protein
MKLKLLSAALLALTLASCKDAIDVPTDNDDNGGNNGGGSGTIVHNNIDVDGPDDDYAKIQIVDSSGQLVKDLGLGMIWSGPGGGKLAYAIGVPEISRGAAHIYVSDKDGNNARKVAEITQPGQRINLPPIISADGSRIAYAATDSVAETVYVTRIHTVRPDGSDHRVVAENLARETMFSISPDGSKIAYFRKDPLSSDPADLVIAQADGSGSTVLKSGLTLASDLSCVTAWSPTGDKIAYTAGWTEGVELYLIDPNGGNEMNLGPAAFPAWSTDGEWLTWSRPNDTRMNTEIVITKDMGLTIEELTSTLEFETHSQISPDKTKVLCTIWTEDPMESPGKLKVIAEPSYSAFWIK